MDAVRMREIQERLGDFIPPHGLWEGFVGRWWSGGPVGRCVWPLFWSGWSTCVPASCAQVSSGLKFWNLPFNLHQSCYWVMSAPSCVQTLSWLLLPVPTISQNPLTLWLWLFFLRIISPSTHNTNISFCIIWKGLRFSPWLGKQVHCNFLTDDRELGTCDALVPVGCVELLIFHSGWRQGALLNVRVTPLGVSGPLRSRFLAEPTADSFSASGSQCVVQQGLEHCPRYTAH